MYDRCFTDSNQVCKQQGFGRVPIGRSGPPLAFPWHPDFVAFPSAHETCNRRVYPRFGRDLVALAKKGVRVAKGWLGPVLEIGKGICKLIACKLQSFGHSLCALARMRFGCSWLFLYLAWCESEKWVKGLSVRYFCHNFFSHCPRHSPLSSMLPGSEPNVVLFLAACLAGKVNPRLQSCQAKHAADHATSTGISRVAPL